MVKPFTKNECNKDLKLERNRSTLFNQKDEKREQLSKRSNNSSVKHSTLIRAIVGVHRSQWWNR
jgi:hypothetical protein